MKILIITILSVLLLSPLTASAEALSYLDEAGNVHFVDRLDQVPEKYRSQIIKPTPRVLTKKEYQQELKKFERMESEKKRDLERKEREKEREKKKLAQLAKKQQKRSGKDRKHHEEGSLSSKEVRQPKETPTPAPISR